MKILSAATIASVTKDSQETALSAKPTSKVVILAALRMLIAKEQLSELVDLNEIQKSVNATVDTKAIQFYLLLAKTLMNAQQAKASVETTRCKTHFP